LLLPEMGLLEAEQMRLLLLDTKNRLIAALTLYAGTVSACQVRVAEVFREAVRRNASALILAHNHPSGMADPSPEDVRLTREVVQAGRLLGVDVLDHLIIGADAYTSLRERGLGWE
jgi:DNA repair protein RadC